jgi:predicted nucleic acid-binding protein
MLAKKLFFDADALIAGSASQTGASFLLLQLCEIRILNGLTCRQVVAECRRNLRKKLPQAEPIFNKIVDRALKFKKNPTPEEQSKYRRMAHPKDLPILTSPITNRADYLITFNTKHFFPDQDHQLTVLPPGEMVKKIRSMLSHLEQINDS